MLTAIQISILTFKAIVFASSVSFLGFLLKSTFAGLVLLKKLRIMMTASVLSQILDLVFYSYISVIVKFDVPAVVILLVYISAIMSYLLLLVRQELAFFRKVIHLTGVNPVMIKRFRIVHFGLYCLGVGSALGTCMECIFSPATFASGLAIFIAQVFQCLFIALTAAFEFTQAIYTYRILKAYIHRKEGSVQSSGVTDTTIIDETKISKERLIVLRNLSLVLVILDAIAALFYGASLFGTGVVDTSGPYFMMACTMCYIHGPVVAYLLKVAGQVTFPSQMVPTRRDQKKLLKAKKDPSDVYKTEPAQQIQLQGNELDTQVL